MTSEPLRPAALRPGDRVAVVAPSSPAVPDPLAAGVATLRGWGFEPQVMPHVHDVHGHLAGCDEERAADLNAALHDPGIRAVFAARGGYGAGRIADRLDWGALRRDPKPIVGFSDLTALLLAAWCRLRLITIHGPFVGRYQRLGPDASAHLRRLLTERAPLGRLARTAAGPPVATIVAGSADGRLLGGNLATLCSLIGTPDQPDLTGAVLLLEDVNEPPYRLDRMLTQLHRAGLLADVAGVVVGELRHCDPLPGRPSLSVGEVLRDRLGALGVPVSYGLAVGHVDHQLAVPLGARVRLDADAGTLSLLEPATRPR